MIKLEKIIRKVIKKLEREVKIIDLKKQVRRMENAIKYES